MPIVIYSSLFTLMLVTLLANPAPVSIELADLILISLPFFLGLLSLAISVSFEIARTEYNLLIAILLYINYLLISVLQGLMHGVPLLNLLRSIGPYLDFFPLLLMCLLPTRLLNPWKVAAILIIVGLCQASYQIYLYLTHANEVLSTIDVLRSRITLIEPRTTLPIVLSTAILPMALIAFKKTYLNLVAMALILFALFSAAATLTRSIILSILVGWITFYILYFYNALQTSTFSFAKWLYQLTKYLLVFIVLLIFISFIPKIYMLEQGLLARFSYNPSPHAAVDYSNGRLYDEWLPALTAWVNSDILNLFFGIGAGFTFTVASGEERTYIHNLSIYSLVYGGLYGLFACLWLYFTIFKTLIIRHLQTQQIIYTAYAALLTSIFFYGQLFAVHKGLAFNAMLFIIITLTLGKPNNQLM